MSSSDRDSLLMNQSQSGHINDKVECLKDTNLKGYLHHWEWRFNYCKCSQITVRNANKSMLPRYSNSDRHKNSSAKLQYIFTCTFCDLQMPRYGR